MTRKARYAGTSIRTAALIVAASFAVVLRMTAAPHASSLDDRTTESAIRTALERLPRYGVFDGIAFRLHRGAVTLEGHAYAPGLVAAATSALEQIPGVTEVADRVETLAISRSDDRIRWITFYQIYTDDVLSRYAPAGASGARFDAFQFGGFPGSQPGGYSIHIVVKGGRTTLVGAVESAFDKQLAAVRARGVGGVNAVENHLVARSRDSRAPDLTAETRVFYRHS